MMRNLRMLVKVEKSEYHFKSLLCASIIFFLSLLITKTVSATHHDIKITAAPNGWQYISTTLEDGRSVHQIQKISDAAVVGPDGKEHTLILAIECRGKESTAAFALKDNPLTIKTSMSRISLQINEEKPRKQRFHRAANKRSLLIRRNGDAIKFVQSLYDKETLRVTAPFTTPKINNAQFTLGDIRKAAEPISVACTWPPVNP